MGAEGSFRVLAAFFLAIFMTGVVEHEEEPGDGEKEVQRRMG